MIKNKKLTIANSFIEFELLVNSVLFCIFCVALWQEKA